MIRHFILTLLWMGSAALWQFADDGNRIMSAFCALAAVLNAAAGIFEDAPVHHREDVIL